MDNLLRAVNGGLVYLTSRALSDLMMMGREFSRLDPSYQHRITFACTGC